jgi:hypothetical protein
MRALADHTAAMAEVEIVREYAPKVDYELEHVSAGLWSWRMSFPSLENDGTGRGIVATPARTFARRVDASRAAERFQQRSQDAELDWTLAVFQPGRRGRVIPFDGEREEQQVREINRIARARSQPCACQMDC